MPGRMRLVFPLLALAALSLVPSLQAGPMYALEADQPNLLVIDRFTGGVMDSIPVVLAGDTVIGGHDLAVHPIDGSLFALLDTTSRAESTLAVLDPTTGSAAPIGTIAAAIATMAFDGSGRLLAVSADTAPQPETLYEVSTATAIVTFLRVLGGGGVGEAMAYAPTTGLLYRRSGNGLSIIDPDTLAVTTIPVTGPTTGEVLGLAWSSEGFSFLATTAAGELISMRTTGKVALVNDGLATTTARGVTFLTDPPALIATDSASPVLRHIHRRTGEELASWALTMSGETVVAGRGLARNPLSGVLFGLLEINGQSASELVTIDEDTGLATSVGDTGDIFTALEFGFDGTLYAVSDDLAAVPETLFSLDPTTGAATSLTALSSGSSGEALAINDNTYLYRHSGTEPDRDYDTILLPSLQVFPVTLSGDLYGEVTGLVYDQPADTFVATTADGELVTIDSFGNAAVIASGLAHGIDRGLAHRPPDRTAIAVESTRPRLMEIDPATGALISRIPLTLGGFTVDGGKGLAIHPLTGIVYGLLKVNGQTPFQLVTIDTETGVCTNVGNTGDRFAGITFASDGTLYAVTGDGAATPETLFTLDPTTGAPSLVLPLGNGNDGEAIGYNPADGLLYHCSGNSSADGTFVFERVDPETSTIEPIPISGYDLEAVAGLSWDPVGGLFLVTTNAGELVALTTDGYASSVDTGLRPWIERGLSLPSQHLAADLAVTMTDPPAPVAAGGVTTLTLTVANLGPESAPGASVTMTLPAEVTAASWTCSGGGGGLCSASGLGAVSDEADLPPGSSVTYLVQTTLSSGAGGPVVVTATALASGVVIDHVPSNDSGQATITVLGAEIFSDDFESGGTSTWSGTGP